MSLNNSDRWLAEQLGISDDEMEQFILEAQERAATGPQPAVVAGIEVSIGTLLLNAAVGAALSVGASLVAGLFKPRAPGAPGRIRSSIDDGTNGRQANQAAPVDGFSGLADSAALGDPISTVYALRETLGALNGRPAGVYGGVRVAMPMLWSNIESRGTYHLGRFVLMVGDGEIASLDPLGYALGGKAISPYNLSTTASAEVGSNVTVYFRANGGRIRATDRVAGRLAANDPGNAENDGAGDVFQVRSVGGALLSASSITGQPSGSTAFGLYGAMPNGLAFRVNPMLKPTRSFFTRSSSSGEVCDPENDPQALAQVWRMISHFSHFSGITSTSISTAAGAFGNLAVNDTFVYTLFKESDSTARFRFFNDNGDAEYLIDVATAVASRQRKAFDSLSIGGIYRCGSCLAVLESLSPSATQFISDADNEPPGGGTTVAASFRVIEAGRVYRPTTQEIYGYLDNSDYSPPDANEDNGFDWGSLDRGPQYRTATAVGQLLRCAVADFTIEGPARVIEIGIKSAIGIRDGGFVDTRRLLTLKEINRRAGGESAGVIIGSGDTFDVSTYQASTNPRPELRYSFFRVLYRLEGLSDFVPLAPCFGVVGTNEQVALNALTVQLPETNNPQIRIIPLSGYEIAQTIATGDLCVLDGTKGWNGPITSGATTIWYRGNTPLSTRPASTFTIDRLEPSIATAIDILSTTTTGQGYLPGTYTDLQLVRSGNASAKGTLVVAGDGNASTAGLTITSRGVGYSTGAFTLAGLPAYAPFDLSGVTVAADTLDYAAGSMPMGNNAAFTISSTGTLPDPLEEETTYYARDRTGTSFKAAATLGGVAVALTTAGTGTITITQAIATPFAGSIASLRKSDLGVLWTEAETLLGSYARLAEISPYPEVEPSCSDGPEHEVVYVNNVTVPNTAPDYDRMAVVGMNIRSGPELTTIEQPSAYCTGGQRVRRLLSSDTEGPSHLLPDLLLDKMLNSKNGAGQRITERMVDIQSFRDAAQWCLDRRYFYDGVIPGQINVLDWASEIAPAFLLRFGESGGKYYLKKAIQFGAVTVKALLTSGNIEQGTFSLNYLEPEDRQRIRVSVRFREERATSNLSSPGLFAVTREILVAESDGTGSEPIENLDMTAYSTNRWHAIDAAKLLIRTRRYSTHMIKAETTYDYETATMAPDDYFRASMEETFYNGFTNGIVTPDGRLISKLPIPNGSYNVLAWQPSSGTAPAAATLVVTGGGTTATPVNRIFTRVDPAAQVRLYRASEILPVDGGRFEISAQDAPTNSSGILLAALDWDSGGAWIIEG